MQAVSHQSSTSKAPWSFPLWAKEIVLCSEKQTLYKIFPKKLSKKSTKKLSPKMHSATMQAVSCRKLNSQPQNRWWKLEQQSTICWNYFGLFRDYSLDYIFFGIKLFLFFKIECWNFQHLFEKTFLWNLTKFKLIQLIKTIFISEILWGFPTFSCFFGKSKTPQFCSEIIWPLVKPIQP